MIKNRVGAVAAALLLGITGAAVAATPAQAAESDCFSGKLCLWNNIEYGGSLYMYVASTSCVNLVSQNNAASSGRNLTSRRVRLYDGANCTGAVMEIFTGMSDGDFRFEPQGLNMNDRVSSFKQI